MDGATITYDTIGNPLNNGTWTYTWQNGRQLAGMSKSGTTVSFKYKANGDKALFDEGFELIRDFVRQHPGLPYVKGTTIK